MMIQNCIYMHLYSHDFGHLLAILKCPSSSFSSTGRSPVSEDSDSEARGFWLPSEGCKCTFLGFGKDDLDLLLDLIYFVLYSPSHSRKVQYSLDSIDICIYIYIILYYTYIHNMYILYIYIYTLIHCKLSSDPLL